MEKTKSYHDDVSLAAKVYPSGTKKFAIAKCYCGDVEIEVQTEDPISTGFCHCVGCRTAHAAPMYHVMYCGTGNIDCRTGKEKQGRHEIQISKGFQKLSVVRRNSKGSKGNAILDRNPTERGLGRLQCSICGTRMLNALIFPEDSSERYGVFPSTFTEKLDNFIQTWQPRRHFNCESAILPVSVIYDGLPKYVKMESGAKFVE